MTRLTKGRVGAGPMPRRARFAHGGTAAARMLALVGLLAATLPATAQVVEMRVHNSFSASAEIATDGYECKPEPCHHSPTAAIRYGNTGEYIVPGRGVAMATVFYRASTNHKSFGCRFSLTVTKTSGSCDVAQILVSPYLSQGGNTPRCAILSTQMPTYPDCRFIVDFGIAN